MPYCVFLPHNLYESGWPVLWKLSTICKILFFCILYSHSRILKSRVFSSIRWHTRFLPNLSGSHLGSWGRVPFLQPQRRCGSSFFWDIPIKKHLEIRYVELAFDHLATTCWNAFFPKKLLVASHCRLALRKCSKMPNRNWNFARFINVLQSFFVFEIHGFLSTVLHSHLRQECDWNS